MEQEAGDKQALGERMKGVFEWLLIVAATAMIAWPATSVAGPLVFQAAGAAPADIQVAVEEFRNFLGANNGVGGTPGDTGAIFPSGRREINWDGVPDRFAAPNNLPANFFNANSPRGVVFFTPGSGFQVSGNAGVAPIEFDNLRRHASHRFATFSPQRLFTALDSPITEILFFVPGTAQAATTRGFGAVFTDVDRANSTKIEYLDINGALLFRRSVPPARGDQTLSFLGVAFDAGEEVFVVRITSGDVELGDREHSDRDIELEDRDHEGRDLVVMDDFIYGEPQPVP
jgi:hypothetical protein